ncbi:MAG TPA: 2-amino-4-hydroxy-6-hydroxymethyldihydropteridine diphosphokinase [Gemmataceae bacterium]|nr:2-amino-4-hydroxy-6-hydroxymethyldihydropteridine diphosphokinase [Gemmataceae bacterium]
MKATAYIALGSNLGDRHANLDEAVRLLRDKPGLQIVHVSSYFETTPVGGPAGQNAYVNAAAEIKTDMTPRQLLETLLEVEQVLGRVRSGERNLPRTLDLDLLLYDKVVQSDAELTLPHPRLHERWFVLAPLAEIAPELVHPVLGRSMRELLNYLPESAGGPLPGRELTGRRALVTGATSGIGKAIALELASAGADVIVHGRRADAVREVGEQIKAHRVQAHTLLAELHEQKECENLVAAAWEQGPVHIWINNAGADTLTGAAAHWPFEKKLKELLNVDVTATMLLSRAAGRRMKQQGQGVILNMGWDQADTGMEGDSGQLFGAAKAAVMAFSKSLALSLAPEVRVNCLAPGWIRTAWGEKASTVWQERVRRETPLGRWGTPEDVARTARWLVSPAAAFITGQVIRINGGAVRG